MSRRARSLLLVWLALSLASTGRARTQEITGAVPANSQAADDYQRASFLSVPEYIAELDRLSDVTSRLVNRGDASTLIRTIPTAWHVQAPAETFEISSEWLRADLGEWAKKPRSSMRDRMVFRLQMLRTEAASFAEPARDASAQRDKLNRILASSEFQSVTGPGWWDQVKRQITAWMFRLLGRLFSSSTIPTIGNILVYGLIAIALLILVSWILRTIRDNAGVETVMPGTLPVSSKEWSAWMAEARAAAAAGNWRDAIHLAYWCGISFLEAQDMWPPDRARTPREYLRLLPSSNVYHPVLRSLTRSFEVVWYGTHPADRQAFSETVTQLEKLGCRYN